MATKVKWTHVWNQETDKYVGFFVDEKDAKAWLKTQANPALIINDKRPKQTPGPEVAQTIKTVDTALAAAIAATKAEEAASEQPQKQHVPAALDDGAGGQGGAREAAADDRE